MEQRGKIGEPVSLGGQGPSQVCQKVVSAYELAAQLRAEIGRMHRRLRHWGDIPNMHQLALLDEQALELVAAVGKLPDSDEATTDCPHCGESF